MSKAQQPSKPKQTFWHRFWHTRLGKLLLFAMVVYSAIFLVVGVPAFFLMSRCRLPPPLGLSRMDDLFGDDGPLRPPPSPGHKMMGQLLPQSLDDMILLGFPLVKQIALQLNTSLGQPEDYVFGSLMVNMNPEKNLLSTKALDIPGNKTTSPQGGFLKTTTPPTPSE
ncbi:hypothetical protein BC826DRAFT_1113847 [Russula brevipes]|nr:hypothetical protein BC826DRAFT_1113847 [Russula brevipes]